MPEQFTQGPSILQSDIVNNLTTDSSTKPLSAAQGKVLGDKIQTVANSDSIGTFSSKSALDTAMDTLLSSVQSNGIHAFSFATSSAFEVFRSTASFIGTLYKSGSNTTFSNVEIFDIGTQTKIIGMRNGNGWSYGQVALNSDISMLTTEKMDAWSEVTSLSTPFSGESYGNGSYYYKFGRFVLITISIKFTSPPTNVKVFTLPSSIYPSLEARSLPMSGGSTYLSQARVVITPQGNVFVTSEDNYVMGSGIYTL